MSSIPDSVSSSMPDTIREANLAAVYAQIMGASGALQDSLLLNPMLNQSNTSIAEDQFKHSLNLLNLEAPRVLTESDLPLNILSAKVDAFMEKEISKLPQPLQGALRTNIAQHAKDEKTLQEFFAESASKGEVVETIIKTDMPPGTDPVSQLREMIYLYALVEVASTVPPSEAPPPTIIQVGPIVNGALKSLEVTQKGALAMLATAPPGYGDYLDTIMSSLHGAMASLQQIQVSDSTVDKQFAVALKTLADDHLKKAQKAIADKAAAEAAEAARKAEEEKQKWTSLGILIGTILIAVVSIVLAVATAGAAAPLAAGATSAAVSAAGTTATVGFSAGSIAMITVDVAGIVIASVDYALNSVISTAMTEAFAAMATAMGLSQAETAGLLIALTALMFVVMKRAGSAGIKALEKVAVSEASATSKAVAKAAAKHLTSLGEKTVVRTITANLALPLLMMSGAVGAIDGGIAEVMFPNDEEARTIATMVLTIVLMLVLVGGIMGGAGSIARGGTKLASKAVEAVKGAKNVANAAAPVAANVGNVASVAGNVVGDVANAGRVVGEGGEAAVDAIEGAGRAVADNAGDAAGRAAAVGGQEGADDAAQAVAQNVDEVAQPAARVEGEAQAVAGDVAAEAPAAPAAQAAPDAAPNQAVVQNADNIAQPVAAEGKAAAGVAEEGISLVDDLKIGLKNVEGDIKTAEAAVKSAKSQLASAEEAVRIAADDLDQLKSAVPPDAKMIMAAEKQLAQAKEAAKESATIVKNAEEYVNMLAKEKTTLETQLKAAQDAAFNSSQLRLEKMVLSLQLTGKFAESGFNVWDYMLNMKMKTLAEAIAKLQKDSLEAKAAQALVQALMDKINADRDSFHDIAQDINSLIEMISQSGNNLLDALQSGGRSIFAG